MIADVASRWTGSEQKGRDEGRREEGEGGVDSCVVYLGMDGYAPEKGEDTYMCVLEEVLCWIVNLDIVALPNCSTTLSDFHLLSTGCYESTRTQSDGFIAIVEYLSLCNDWTWP